MAKAPENMTAFWIRDEEGDLRKRVKKAARQKGQTVADFLRRIVDPALEDTDTSFFDKSDRKIGQSESNGCCNKDQD